MAVYSRGPQAPESFRTTTGTADPTRIEVAPLAVAGQVPQCTAPPLPWLALGRHSADTGPLVPVAADLGIWLGYSHGVPIWVSCERPLYVLGAARSGKGVNFVVNAILGAPGAVITTSTRVDNLEATAVCRAARGPVEVFNLDGVGGRPHTIAWSPLEGCADPQIAKRRAATLVGSSGLGGENQVWATSSGGIVQAMLHAAAISGRTIDDVYFWSRSPRNADAAMRILEAESQRPGGRRDGWHQTIAAVREEDARMQSNKWFGVENAFAGLSVAAVRKLLSAPLGDNGLAAPGTFDTEAFLRAGGTCYMVARGSDSASATAGGVGGFYSLFLDHVTDTARRLSQTAPGGRLDPPLALVLDELANIHPWQAAPRMTSAGSGEGVWTMLVMQSREQGRESFGENAEGTMWDNCANLILGGGKSSQYLGAISTVVGEREHERTRASWNSRTPLERSTSVEGQWRPGISEAELRRLPAGVAVMLEAGMRTALLDLVPYWDREHGRCIKASKRWHATHPGLVVRSQIVPIPQGKPVPA